VDREPPGEDDLASPPVAALYRQVRDALWQVAEPRRPYTAAAHGEPSEHFLHVLWQQQQLLRQPFRTLDGRMVTIYRPGRWSRGSGPDFLEAKLRFDGGPIQVGAVELHVLASDWSHHGHDRDPAYAEVLLHVIWANDLSESTVATSHGTRLPQIALSSFLEGSLAELQEALDVEGSLRGTSDASTPCQRALQEMAPDAIGRLLDMAGEERWRQRANRFALKVERRGVEQALYEWLLEALGFQGNRLPFWELARLAPIARLRQALVPDATPLRIQAVLYGVAGFLRQWRAARTSHSQEGRAYVEGLLQLWDPLAHLFPEQLGERQWRMSGIRPANSPQRRIAAAGYLLQGLTQHTLMDLFLTPLRELPPAATPAALRHCQRDLLQPLRVTGEEDFWSHRYTLPGKRLGHAVDLLGPGRAATLVVDVLLPAASALAEMGHEHLSSALLRTLYQRHPRLPANEITREMMRQFFGADRSRAAVVNSACRQQALLQLYRDFCTNEQETCQECALPRLAVTLEALRHDAPPREL